MRICYCLFALGDPYYDHKKEILQLNIDKIKKSLDKHDYELDFVCNLYSEEKETDLYDFVNKMGFNNILINSGKGVLAELMMRYFKYNNYAYFKKYDYIILTLDDIEFVTFDYERIINLIKANELDILSLSLSNNSPGHAIMRFRKNDCHITKFCEMFCYVMHSSSFIKYCSKFSMKSPAIWGMDIALVPAFNFNIAIDYKWRAIHYYKAINVSAKRSQEKKNYLESVNLSINSKCDYNLYGKIDIDGILHEEIAYDYKYKPNNTNKIIQYHNNNNNKNKSSAFNTRIDYNKLRLLEQKYTLKNIKVNVSKNKDIKNNKILYINVPCDTIFNNHRFFIIGNSDIYDIKKVKSLIEPDDILIFLNNAPNIYYFSDLINKKWIFMESTNNIYRCNCFDTEGNNHFTNAIFDKYIIIDHIMKDPFTDYFPLKNIMCEDKRYGYVHYNKEYLLKSIKKDYFNFNLMYLVALFIYSKKGKIFLAASELYDSGIRMTKPRFKLSRKLLNDFYIKSQCKSFLCDFKESLNYPFSPMTNKLENIISYIETRKRPCN